MTVAQQWERVEFVKVVYEAYTRVIPITTLNAKEVEKFKSCQVF